MSLKAILFERAEDLNTAAWKSGVALGGTGLSITGSDIAGWLTCVYVTFQIFLLLKPIRERLAEYWKRWREK